jgi:hypothetical protein
MPDCKYHRNETGLHRLDGPAVEHKNGHKEWWVNGLLHRLDGPAVETNKDMNSVYAVDNTSKTSLYEYYPKICFGGDPNEWWVDGVIMPDYKQKILNVWWINKCRK